MELRGGSRFRGLLVHSELGRGGMGISYMASHGVLRRPVVIKRFVETHRDVLAEASLAARVQTPHVVAVLDAGLEDGVPFLVQRYVDGLDLGEVIKRRGGPLSPGVTARLLADAATGLREIHLAGVVHGDIKPENVFVSGFGEAVIGDFGLAREWHRPEDTKLLAGSPMYMAPELWLHQPATPKTDLYALGASANQVRTGRAPFDGANVVELCMAHKQEAYRRPPAQSPEDAYLFEVIASCLQKEPENRPANADAVRNQLLTIAARPQPWISGSRGSARIGDVMVVLRRGDLAAAEADVIVNAANWQLTMEVGVARSLAKAAGPGLADAAQRAAPVSMGDVVWTDPGELSCKEVAHAVSALAGAIAIQRATLRVLLDAQRKGHEHVAFPALGTGVGGVPHALGAKLLLAAVATFARLAPAKPISAVEVVLADEAAFEIWAEVLDRMTEAA